MQLNWSADERAALRELADAASGTTSSGSGSSGSSSGAGGVDLGQLLGTLPPGVHVRPYGADALLLLWEFMHLPVRVSLALWCLLGLASSRLCVSAVC